MLLHLADDCDCTSARFVWLRASDPIKSSSKELQQTWSICESLRQLKFKDALSKLEKREAHQFLKRVLQQDYIPRLVSKAYSKVSRDQLCSMLGIGTSDKELSKLGLTLEGTNFVSVKSKGECEHQFLLDKKRVQQMT